MPRIRIEMCDYCDCRTMLPIAELGAEHERLLDLSSRARRAVAGGDGTAARRILGELVAILAVHTAVEEAGLLAELRAEGELDDHVADLLEDHRAAGTALDALTAPEAGPGWGPAVTAFLDDLAAHIRREESDLFPASIPALSPAAWDRVALARARVAGGRDPAAA